VTDWSSLTGGKELAEVSGTHIGKATSLVRFCRSKLISTPDRHHGKAYSTTVIVTLFFLNNLQFGLENDMCFARCYTIASIFWDLA
jgi:hypothetical protein